MPVVLLFLAGPPLRWLEVDRSWLIGRRRAAGDAYRKARLIGAAMLLGSILAALVSPRRAAASTQAFFEGAGYAFTRIVSVIVVANCFGKAMEAIGLRRRIWPAGQEGPCSACCPVLCSCRCCSPCCAAPGLPRRRAFSAC